MTRDGSDRPGSGMVTVIRARTGLAPIDFPQLWRYRELFVFLGWRDILIRYKQTAIGVAWALLQPLLTMVVFSVVFGKLAGMPSNGAPYPVMTFAALLPWMFFATALTQGANSLVAASGMISKVYFPRMIIPAATTLSGAIDFCISLAVLVGLMLSYRVPFQPHLLLLPLFFLLAFATALGVGLFLGALNVKYRDVKHAIPFLVQAGLYVSPVGFASSVVPEQWRLLYGINPMAGVIDGFRWCILGPSFEPYWPGFWVGTAVAVVVLVGGAYYFRNTERTFADVI
jgi:lipopolysaccharide transport system permease protein